MKKLPDKKELDIMWTVATSGALETGTRPHYGFADMLYDYLNDIAPPVGLYNEKGHNILNDPDDNLNERIASALQEAIAEYDT